MVERIRPLEEAVSIEAFEEALAGSVRRRIAETGLAAGPFVLHPLRASPLVVGQDFAGDETQVGYTAGARTCTMLSLWGRTSDGLGAVLAVLHEGGMDEAYRRMEKVGADFLARGASVELVSYTRGELAQRFGVLDEGLAKESLGEAASPRLRFDYVPSKDRPVSYGLVAEGRSGRAVSI